MAKGQIKSKWTRAKRMKVGVLIRTSVRIISGHRIHKCIKHDKQQREKGIGGSKGACPSRVWRSATGVNMKADRPSANGRDYTRDYTEDGAREGLTYMWCTYRW